MQVQSFGRLPSCFAFCKLGVNEMSLVVLYQSLRIQLSIIGMEF